jgi:predicted GNAT family N-acyltransferase
MNIQFISHDKIDEKSMIEICKVKDESWPFGLNEQKNWIKHNIKNNDIHVLLYNDRNSLIGYTNIVKRTCEIEESTSNVLFGIGNVCVSNKVKKSGIGMKMMLGINKYLIAEDARGVLFCKDQLVGFYQKCNWKVIGLENIIVDYSLSNINTMIFNIRTGKKIRIFGNSF